MKDCPKNVWGIGIRNLDQLYSAMALDELRTLPGKSLEVLSESRSGKFSIRINDQYRICFEWTETSPMEDQSELTRSHYIDLKSCEMLSPELREQTTE